MNNRIRVSLSREEFEALLALSAAELRSPADQAHIILRTKLEQLGLISASGVFGDVYNSGRNNNTEPYSIGAHEEV